MDIFAGAASFDGWTLYEGDIVLDLRTRLLIQGGHLRRKRAVKKLESSRWPNGEIPYVVDRDLGKLKTMLEFTYFDQTLHSSITLKLARTDEFTLEKLRSATW